MRPAAKSKRPAEAPPAFAFVSRVGSQALVRAVAIGRVLRLLAAAEPGGRGLLSGEGLRRHADRLVRAVAERLVRRPAAGAPVIGLADFEVLPVRRLLGDDGFRHDRPPKSARAMQLKSGLAGVLAGVVSGVLRRRVVR